MTGRAHCQRQVAFFVSFGHPEEIKDQCVSTVSKPCFTRPYDWSFASIHWLTTNTVGWVNLAQKSQNETTQNPLKCDFLLYMMTWQILAGDGLNVCNLAHG